MATPKPGSDETETKPLISDKSAETDSPKEGERNPRANPKMLIFSFVVMIGVGLGNKIFQKLQTIPMRNYPYFLNLLTTFIYIPMSFAYIIPVMFLSDKIITKQQRRIPLYKFAIMGALDGIAGIMQIFAVTQLDGSLQILLQQAAIPTSMIISRFLLKTKYGIQNYIGAVIVVAGLIVVLIPQFQNTSGGKLVLVWALVMILSCIPMTLSSVYKEKALGEEEIDVVYLNGWVAVFQFILTLLVAVPAAYASNLTPRELPQNVLDGAKCYIGINSIKQSYTVNGQVVQKDACGTAPYFVSIYMGFNLLYNVFIILILKHGSSNVLWLALTIMVPLGNVAFSLKFVPEHKALKFTDIIGLVLIMLGLVIYRFWDWIALKLNICQKKHKELVEVNK